MTRALAFASALLAVALLPATASAAVHTETGTAASPAGEVKAELSYDKVDEFRYRDVRIKITRGGAVLIDALVPEPCDECGVAPAGGGDPTNPSLQVRDLDANGEPEVLVDLFTGGAHCCSFTQIYGYADGYMGYRRTKGSWYDYGYTLRDLDGDGSPELESADWTFAGAFTAYAASGAPPQIWKYGNGKLNDVTRGYRKIVKKNLKQYLGLYKQYRDDREIPDVRGFLAAYAADKYLLGQGDTAFDLIYAAYRRGDLAPLEGDTSPSGKRYISALRKHLRKTGYR